MFPCSLLRARRRRRSHECMSLCMILFSCGPLFAAGLALGPDLVALRPCTTLAYAICPRSRPHMQREIRSLHPAPSADHLARCNAVNPNFWLSFEDIVARVCARISSSQRLQHCRCSTDESGKCRIAPALARRWIHDFPRRFTPAHLPAPSSPRTWLSHAFQSAPAVSPPTDVHEHPVLASICGLTAASSGLSAPLAILCFP
jgi:hypothetical protein